MLHRLPLVVLLAVLAVGARAQSSDTTPYFTVEVNQLNRQNGPALHSSAWAQHDGRWLFITGRTDGLHPLTPVTESFPAQFAQGAAVVYDPGADQVWTATLDVLDDTVADPLRTTNTQFHQDGETLYITGGYGVDSATSEKTTFGVLTAIDVPRMINAVRTGTPIADHIRQIAEPSLAVTGGHLAPYPDGSGRYALLGGHFYAGEYLTASEVQIYTEAIRLFEIVDDGTTLALANASEITDAALYHRRDGNVGPTIDPATGAEGLALYGGVFQPTALRPYRTPIFIDDTGTATESSYESYFGHYTTPVVSLFDPQAHAMHAVFIGGMGLYYGSDTDQGGCLPRDERFICEDGLVPFIPNVTVLSVAEDGTIGEALTDTDLNALLGTNAAYIPNPEVTTYANGVVNLRALSGRTLVGHFAGGIEASQPNAGWMMQPSIASDKVFAVYVTPLPVQSAEAEQPAGFRVEPAAPNPFRTTARLTVSMDAPGPLAVEVFDLVGRRVAVLHNGPLAAGPHTFAVDGTDWPSGVYVARIAGERGTTTQRLVRLR